MSQIWGNHWSQSLVSCHKNESCAFQWYIYKNTYFGLNKNLHFKTLPPAARGPGSNRVNTFMLPQPYAARNSIWSMLFTTSPAHLAGTMPTLGIPAWMHPQMAKFMGPTWGPSDSCRPQMGPMLAPWTLLSGSHVLMCQLNRRRA